MENLQEVFVKTSFNNSSYSSAVVGYFHATFILNQVFCVCVCVLI